MIIGNGTALLFTELNDAVEALQGDRTVCLNAHTNPNAVPDGAIVYNQENVPGQVPTSMFAGRELWDFSERNCAAWRAAGREVTHVPVGYHPSMERFTMRPWEERDIDVVFTGLLNDRRRAILLELEARGLKVEFLPPGIYGAERDAVLARSKLAIAPLYYPDGVFGTLRAAHCVANKLYLVSEEALDMPSWLPGSPQPYEWLVTHVTKLLGREHFIMNEADRAFERFKAQPMVLPGPKPRSATAWTALCSEPSEWDLEAMYAEHRGKPVSATPHVCIMTPMYREDAAAIATCEASRVRVEEDLNAHGIATERSGFTGDSLVQRMRQRSVHAFLKSSCTHLLFWDADIEALDPTCVRAMLRTGHDVIAGACPFKNTKRRVVCNLWPEDEARLRAMVDGENLTLPHGCIEVMDAGTGFMLISRKALVDTMQAHPELLHWSRAQHIDGGEPLWAIFDTGVVDGAYQSEDFMFCHHWQKLGGKVYVYVPATFRHYGMHGFEASFVEQYMGAT